MVEQLDGLEGKLHVIAHSMGNRALTKVWQSMFNTIDSFSKLEVGQVVFAAPDVYQAAFKDDTEGIAGFCERATVYANRSDFALGLSRLISQTDRAGVIPPVMSLDQIDTIEVSFNLALFGHTYFAKLIPMLDDLANLIEHNEAPGSGTRSHLQQQSSGASGHWLFHNSDG
jgi:esterase/lipase superfamily enzyme